MGKAALLGEPTYCAGYLLKSAVQGCHLSLYYLVQGDSMSLGLAQRKTFAHAQFTAEARVASFTGALRIHRFVHEQHRELLWREGQLPEQCSEHRTPV